MFSQWFIIGLDHYILFLVGVFVDSAFLEDFLDFLVQGLIDTFEVVADHLRPNKISSDSFGCPFGRCFDKETSIIADLICNFDDFSIIVCW